ncbi:hypothetical protein A6A04_06430 [Paramagnetospirillum marisnigri]|uniref:Cytochrome c domain-containing protein n=1 Tax=Paramagnetospirillum marisnigri TaxID=1285242 RepID=A0A178MD46_9PROT|nr:cytochrome c [Paramagnetospirillum marisnigri]OAN46731.1 hypothetical protein A6A04_06430 [Paramagnetospirillum marisnigri]
MPVPDLILPAWLPWPLPFRLGLAVLDEPRLAGDIHWGLGWAAAALVLALAALAPLRRRFRLGLLAAAALVAALLAWPRIDLLFVPAYPTSFRASPTGFSAAAIARGEGIYARHCQSCHGAEGHGDGPEAARQPIPPADLTAEHLWDHPLGEMFWWISRGMTAPDGRPSMPGFADRLSEVERWELIDFLHANAAGADLVQIGLWTHVIDAPDLVAVCGDGRRVQLRQLSGQPVHLLVADKTPLPEAGTNPAFRIGGGPATDPASPWCAVEDPASARTAYSIASAQSPEGLEGSQFLVGTQGHLLAHWTWGTAPAADTLVSLAQSLGSVCLAPRGVDSATRHAAHRDR